MMIMLDTHVLLWWLDDPEFIKEEARTVIGEGRHTVFVSTAVIWEILIKKALGKLEAPDNIDEVLQEERFLPLAINLEHVLTLPTLPPIHNDPFDRIQAAQAKSEGLHLVTPDKNLHRYDISYIEA